MKTHNAGTLMNRPPGSKPGEHNTTWPLQRYLLNDGLCQRSLTLTNSEGRVYPTLHEELMVQLLQITPQERVLDIGGGDAPFGRANVVTDAFPDMNAHRSGRAVQRGQAGGTVEFVPCFAEALPFPDKAFDVAYCRMVLEHVIDPAAACHEMMRVARRGFLETPAPLAEYLGGHSTHRWIVWVERLPGKLPTLVFRRKPFRRAPLAYALRGPWFDNANFRFAWEWQYRNIVCTQFAWEGEFAFRIEETTEKALEENIEEALEETIEEALEADSKETNRKINLEKVVRGCAIGIDYDMPAQAAEAHLDAAINSLCWGDVPAAVIIPDADQAVALCPEWALAHNTRGCALWLAARYDEAGSAFRRASCLEPQSPEYAHNATLLSAQGRGARPTLITLDKALGAHAIPDFLCCAVTRTQIEKATRLLLNLPPIPFPASHPLYARLQSLWNDADRSGKSENNVIEGEMQEACRDNSPPASASEPLWDRKITLQLRGRTHVVPLTNFAGRNFPTLHEGLMTELLTIQRSERVLDIGSGAAPFARADVTAEMLPAAGMLPTGYDPDRPGSPSLQGAAPSLPFADDEFDVVYCRDGLAQAHDPAAVCREMMRVAKRGFLETPSPSAEFIGDHPTHRWLISVERNITGEATLVFRRRPFLRPPLRYALRANLFSDSDFRFRWEWLYRNLVTTQFSWEGSFSFRIEEMGESEEANAFNYDDPVQAAEAHLDRAICLLRFSKVPLAVILADIDQALLRRPDWALAHNTKGCAFWNARQFKEALPHFQKAAGLEPARAEYGFNRSLNASQPDRPAKLVVLPPTREEQENIATNFAGKVYYAFVNFDDRLAQDIGILPGELVLDVGGGQRPLKRADVNIDFDVFDGLHRQGQAISREKPLVCGDVQTLPFRDKAFDVVCCRMVLEHVMDPAAACTELQRVARRGFLETPNTFWEVFYGHPTHRWLIEWEAATRTLVFKRKPFDQIPFRSAIVPYLYLEPDIQRAFEITFRNVTTTQIVWDEASPFSVRVEEDPDCPYDYLARPEDAVRGSLTYSRDLLEGGLFGVAVAEAEDALKQAPTPALREETALLRLRIAQKMADTHKQGEMQSLLQKLKREAESNRDTQRIASDGFAQTPAWVTSKSTEDWIKLKIDSKANPTSPAQSAGLTWSAPLHDPSGYADEARHFLFALASAGTIVTARDRRWSDKVAILPAHRERLLQTLLSQPTKPGAVHVSHILAPHFQRDPSACLNIGRTMFETDRLPPGWAEACNQMDAVWVPGAFNVETFAGAGVLKDKLHIVPGAIDLTPYQPNCIPLRIDGARRFNFLSVFDWTLRKGWDVLVRAFVEEFRADEDVALILKTHSSLGYTGRQQLGFLADYLTHTLGRDLNHIPDIIVQDSHVTEVQMPNLYRAADCYVMPSRGEGWGRPYMEALAMGLPVIATGWSGQTAFLNETNSYVLDCTLVPVSEAGWRETPTYAGHRWAEPSLPHLRTLLRQVFEDRAEGQRRGQAGRAHLETHFSYGVVAARITEVIENMLS